MFDVDAAARAGRDGDPVALERFVRGIQGDVWRFAAHLTRPEDSDDLAQEALFRVIKNLHRWERGPVLTWALGVTRNVCREDIRRRTVRRTDPVAEPEVGHSPDTTDAVATMQLLRALPEDQREAIVLTQLIGLPYADAARVAGCPIGTIRSRVARGRTALAEALDDDSIRGLA
ncbi:MAG: sigma-70 family RNA polymerase sigma factor [Ilumatobacter sp.]|uniref:sigma-70 family RNA polymerase sigma factor n=1 Tax=Ilumatobacter sp. TaxID=1967498 RepID=UPI003919FC61